MVFPGHFHQLFDLGGLVRGIGIPPVRGGMVGIVLGAVNVGVHFVLPVEAQLAQAGFMAPGGAVEAFHRAAELNVRPVRDFPHGQHHGVAVAGLFAQLAQWLHGVKRPALRHAGQQFVSLRPGGTDHDGRFPGKSRRLGRQFGLLGNGINGGRAHDGGRQQDRHAKATLKKLKAIHDNAR